MTNKIRVQLDELNKSLSGSMTTEDIEKLGAIKAELDSIDELGTKMQASITSTQEALANTIKFGGSSEPERQTGSKQPRSLEEIAKEILSKK